jgi:hypothetical protein
LQTKPQNLSVGKQELMQRERIPAREDDFRDNALQNDGIDGERK